VKDRPPAPGAGPIRATATASCSGRSCHGGDSGEDGPRKGSEYARWELADPHARAYDTLHGKKSKEIMGRLGGEAHADARCLACHSHPRATTPEPGRLHPGGTGCEACHGRAEKWLGPHSGGGWKNLEPKEKSAEGMAALADPAALAAACAGCHVGAPPDEKAGLPLRDVTHELIAAGHPPLRFDLVTYVANMPPHWESKQRAGREAEMWLADQVVSGRHAAALAASHGGDGPEFADFACYACHHRITGRGRPGKLVLASWYLGLTGPLSAELPNGAAVRDALAALKSAPRDGAKARGLANALGAAEADLRPVDEAKRGRLRQLLLGLPQEEMARWERAAQAYHGLRALGGAESKASELLRRLTFPAGNRGPAANFGEEDGSTSALFSIGVGRSEPTSPDYLVGQIPSPRSRAPAAR
jgi:hypothetical protein